MMPNNSVTSLITYLQCPRLYYHKFVSKKLSFPHIDLIKGNSVHTTLKKFWGEYPPLIIENERTWVVEKLKNFFFKNWADQKKAIRKLGLNEKEIKEHEKDCLEMLTNWAEFFLNDLKIKNVSIKDLFEEMKPITEEEFYDEDNKVRGFIDLIYDENGEKIIMDYKTSNAFDMTKEYKLQLFIYAYLYSKKYGKKPDKIGIFFLRERPHLISVDESMINYAKKICEEIKAKTISRDMKDYPQNEGYLCKKLGGKCPCHKYDEIFSL